MSGSWQEPEKKRGTYLKCALYSLRMGDKGKSSQFCKQIQAEALDVRKSEVLGHLSFREQKYGDAVKYFGKILHKQKEFDLCEPDSFRIYGQTLYELKKYDEAIPILQKGFERIKSDDPTTARRLVLLGKCHIELKQFVKGAETIEMACALPGRTANELLMKHRSSTLSPGSLKRPCRASIRSLERKTFLVGGCAAATEFHSNVQINRPANSCGESKQ